MSTKDSKSFYATLDQVNLEVPPIVVVSGSDGAAFDTILKRIKGMLEKSVGPYEMTLFSGEPGDDKRLLEEAFNVPLFAPYRLMVVRQGQEVFKPILSSKARLSSCVESFTRLPDRTWVLFHYEGAPPAKFMKIFGKRVLHHSTRDLFPNQVAEEIYATARRFGLALDDHAVHELRERSPCTSKIRLAANPPWSA